MPAYFEALPERLRVSLTDAALFPEHLHTQAELLYLFSGAAAMTVDGAVYSMSPGDLCVCFPGVVHGYLEPRDAQALMLIFSPDQTPEFDALMARSQPAVPLLRREQLPEDVGLCMELMRREIEHGRDERVLRGYLQVVMARTTPLLSLEGRAPETADITYGILKYLSGHFAEPISLNDLSRALGVSRSHLSHTFSHRIGSNFRTYVNTLRVDQACLLLRSTEHDITRIAYECGFETQRSFNRAFQERCGMTPSEYRRRQGMG